MLSTTTYSNSFCPVRHSLYAHYCKVDLVGKTPIFGGSGIVQQNFWLTEAVQFLIDSQHLSQFVAGAKCCFSVRMPFLAALCLRVEPLSGYSRWDCPALRVSKICTRTGILLAMQTFGDRLRGALLTSTPDARWRCA